ncbi:hypothetical protein QAD02_009930 [Eretmocerus hayati]|uniref:Uncharacterized protein n=1 Tax=Eretmocerus hayati TaxID=131215 RepID=A0ACC2NAR8_9HYME|nr:hypothetical protein QAD02_009930 [Eretmocerus hayati]
MVSSKITLWSLIACVVSHEIQGAQGPSNFRRRSRRSVGGSNASQISDYPYMASIRYAGHHICGGSIISSDIILTAAHCVTENLFLDLLYVKVGHTDINYRGSWYPVFLVVQHEGYKKYDLLGENEPQLLNDIALVKLANHIQFDNITTRPIQLFKKYDEIHNFNYGIMIGWGQIPTVKSRLILDPENIGYFVFKQMVLRSPLELQFVKLNIGSEDMCSKLYPSAILEDQFCTNTFGKKPCAGDSGSPFVVNGRLAGLVSSGSHACSGDENSALFINIAKFDKWIKRTMKILRDIDVTCGEDC